jgi:hypothetical protein
MYVVYVCMPQIRLYARIDVSIDFCCSQEQQLASEAEKISNSSSSSSSSIIEKIERERERVEIV